MDIFQNLVKLNLFMSFFELVNYWLWQTWV